MRKVSLVLMASLMAFALLGMNISPAVAGVPACTWFKIVPYRSPDTSVYPNRALTGGETCTVEWIFYPFLAKTWQNCCDDYHQQSSCGMCIDLYGNPSGGAQCEGCYGYKFNEHCE